MKEQMRIEVEQLPDLLEACVRNYIDSFNWYFYFRELDEGTYTFITKKEKKNEKV